MNALMNTYLMPSWSKLLNLNTMNLKCLKEISEKTEGLLVEEMEKNQKLIEEQDAFSSSIDNLTI